MDELDQYEASLQPEEASPEDALDAYESSLQVQPLHGPLAKQRYGGQAAMVAGAPADPAVLGQLALAPDTKAERRSAVDAYVMQQRQGLADITRQVIETQQGELLEQALHSSAAALRKQAEIDGSVMRDELIYAQVVAPGSDEDIQLRMAQHTYAANQLAEMAEAQTWMESVGDFMGMLVPLGAAKDIQDVPGEVSKRAELSAIAAEDWETMLARWNQLPVEQRQPMIKPLLDAILDATKTDVFGQLQSDGPNVAKAQSILTHFFSGAGAFGARAAQAEDALLAGLEVLPGGLFEGVAPAVGKAAGKIVKMATTNVIKKSHPAKLAEEAGEIKASAAHTFTSLTNPDVAKSMGTTTTEAALGAMPIHTGSWYPGVVNADGVPGSVVRMINEAMQTAAGFTRSLTTESGLLQIGAISKSSRQAVQKSFFAKMEKAKEDYLLEGLEMDNLTIVKEGKEGFTYQYTLRDAAQQVPGQKEKLQMRSGQVDFRINQNTGTFEATTRDALGRQLAPVLSPSAGSILTPDGDFSLAVTENLIMDDLAAAMTRQVADMYKWAFQPVMGLRNKKSLQRVEDAIAWGDVVAGEAGTTGRVFTPAELAVGFEIPGREGLVRLTKPSEVEAYYRARMFADTLWKLEDSELAREQVLAGFTNSVQFFRGTVDGATDIAEAAASQAIAKPYQNSGAAKLSLRANPSEGIWDDAAGKVVNYTDEYIDEVYAAGDVLVKTRRPWNTKGTGELDMSGEFVNYARVSRDRLGPRPESVLPYKPGYYPKIGKYEFMVRQEVPMIMRGKPGATRTQAVRAFDSLEDAKKFREELIVKFMAKNDLTDRGPVEKMFPDPVRETSTPMAARTEEAVASHNGLFQGTRSKDELLFGLTGQQIERVGPLEAFQRYVAHVGNFVSRNEMRIGQEKQWLNTVQKMWPDVKLEGFANTKIPTTTPEGKRLDQLRRQIMHWNSIPTAEENLFQGWLQTLHDKMLNGQRAFGFGSKESIKSLQWLKHSNPITALKAANMHALLGALSPVQVFVQASSALVAIAKHPVSAPRAVVDSFRFSMLDNIRNDNALGKALKLMKAEGLMTQEAIDAYSVYRRTGLYEGMHNNADLAKVSSDGLGMTASFFRNAGNISLYTYRIGEATNRRLSFLIELDRWQRATGKKIPTDDELFDILSETHKNMLTLGGANAAPWQGGAGTGLARQTVGMATQFMQVGAKTMEFILKGEARGGFTKAQKIRIAATQVAFFGMAAVPLGGAVLAGYQKLYNLATGKNLEMDEAQAEITNQGLSGWLVNTVMGGDLEIAERLSITGSAEMLLEELFVSDDPLFIKAFGPGGSGTIGRTFKAIEELSVLFLGDRTGMEDLSTKDMQLALSIIADIPSSTRNLAKGNLMENWGMILNNRGRPVVKKDFDMITEIGTKMGWRPSAETRARNLQNYNFDRQDVINDYVDLRVKLMHRLIFKHKLNPDHAAGYARAFQMLEESFSPYENKLARESIREKVWADRAETIEEREVAKYLKTTAAQHIGENAILELGLMDGLTSGPAQRPVESILSDRQEKN